MTRADRVLGLEALLRGRGTTTVGALAEELGVSTRSVRRDLALLRERGIPIDAEAGPGGGVRLAPMRGVAAVHLGVAEVVALWLGATLAAGASGLPWSHASGSALGKLLASVPRERAAALRALARRVLVGPPATANVRAGSSVPPAELLTVIEIAFAQHVAIGFDYADRNGQHTARRVEPHGLLVQTPVWYVLARDVEKREPRMFRMDRIARPRVLRGTPFRPDAAVLAALEPEKYGWRPLLGR